MKKPFSKLFGLKEKEEDVEVARQNGNVVKVSVERIVPNRYQPRQIFDEEKLKSWLNLFVHMDYFNLSSFVQSKKKCMRLLLEKDVSEHLR